MASPTNVAFVLVPGSFATPAIYDKIRPILERKGYTVKDAALLSANDGSRKPAATMEDDAAYIRSVIISQLDAGKNVVLAVQSYGGLPGSEATKGLSKAARAGKPAVIGILYAASFSPDIGQSVRSIMGEAMPETFRIGVPGGYFDGVPAEMAPAIFNDFEDAAEVAKIHASMTGHSSDSYSGKASYAAWKDIPGTTVIPENDYIVPPPIQEALYEHAIANGGTLKRVLVPGASHAVTISQPQLVADELVKLAGQ